MRALAEIVNAPPGALYRYGAKVLEGECAGVTFAIQGQPCGAVGDQVWATFSPADQFAKVTPHVKTYAHRTSDGRTVRVTVPGNEDARALEELTEAARDARLVLQCADRSKAWASERDRVLVRLEAALRATGVTP